MSEPKAIVRYLDEVDPITCPYGNVRRIVTGGDGGVANVHRVRVLRGTTHYHAEYDEVYYVLGGTGTITMGEETHELRPGAVVVIPRQIPHSLEADTDEPLDFLIFGTPAMSIEDERALPRK
ncbi:MAG: cupin domain-containing protein [Planctomycetota bacterium]